MDIAYSLHAEISPTEIQQKNPGFSGLLVKRQTPANFRG
jgi:hypothetical protein